MTFYQTPGREKFKTLSLPDFFMAIRMSSVLSAAEKVSPRQSIVNGISMKTKVAYDRG
jgi:hypothetical protein